jgi:hypothetical protein
MWIFNYYRLFSSVAAGGAAWFFFKPAIWLWILITILFRTLWYFTEIKIRGIRIDRWFEKHQYDFKQLTGPYGIRLINKAAEDPAVRRSLAEVFTPDLKALRKNVDQMEVLDTLFKAGMRPDGDDYQLHDLKLKYGRHRLEQIPATVSCDTAGPLPDNNPGSA